MQTFAHTPAHAQHIPDGWSFPTLSAAVPPPAAPTPVTGGGAAATTVTRVRWGRVLPMLAGVALLAFGIWSVTNSGAAASGSRSTASGGGTSEVDVSRSVGSNDSTAGTDETSTGDDAGVTTLPDETPVTTPAAHVAPRTTPTTGARAGGGVRAGGTRTGGARRAGGARRNAGRRARRTVAGGGAFAVGTASASTAPGTRAGGGSPTGELPMTGIETWIAGILGVLLLGMGICVHVTAVRLATTSMLYRRGILLRPTECARMAQEHGLGQLRVKLSDILHRLLEEPAGGSDFVSARRA